ncbi:MAG: HD domain-containing protein [Syntrophobacteraceae bacterium]
MTIPSRGECFALMQEVGVPLHIQKHCSLVAEIAIFLGWNLRGQNIQLDLNLIQAGALLHDIAKMHCLTTGGKHDALGAKMVQEWGFFPLAPIIGDHVIMDLERATGPITETILVNYADKRVKHDCIVTLEERFADLIERYAHTPAQKSNLQNRFDLYFILERRIFEHLDISPTEPELMLLSSELESKYCLEGYEPQEIDCSIIGRRQVR